MAGYIGSRASVVSSGAERKKTFDITGTTTVLTGLSYTPTFVHLFHNGVRLVDGTDYTATNGTSITLTTAAENGDQVVVVSFATFQAADAYTKAEADAGFVSDPNGAVTVDGSGNVIVNAGKELRLNRPDGAIYGAISHGASGTGIVYNDANGDGHHFQLGGSERMRIDPAGRVTMPYQPFFKARSQPSVNITTQGQILPFDVVDKNIGGYYNDSTFTFTAPVNGSYVFNVMLFTPPNLTSFDYFYVNGTRLTSIEQNHAPTGYTNRSDVFVVYLAAGDAVSVIHWLGTTHLNGSYAGPHSYFSGYLIG